MRPLTSGQCVIRLSDSTIYYFFFFFSFTTLTCLPKKLTRNEISLVWMETKFLIINCKRTNIIKIWHSQKTFISQAQQFNYVVDLTLREIFMSVYLFMQLLFPEYVVYCRSFPRSTCTSVILLFVFFYVLLCLGCKVPMGLHIIHTQMTLIKIRC